MDQKNLVRSTFEGILTLSLYRILLHIIRGLNSDVRTTCSPRGADAILDFFNDC